MDNIAQSISESSHGNEVYFSTIDLRYAYSQLPLDGATTKHCKFNIIGGQATGTHRFLTGFYGLARRIPKGYRHHTKRPQKHI